MNEKFMSEDKSKIPTPLLVIYLVLAPLLTNILSNPTIDNNTRLWTSILIIIIMGLLAILHFYIQNKENQRVYDQNKIQLENRKMELDHELKLKQMELDKAEGNLGTMAPFVKQIINKFLNDPDKFDKFLNQPKKKEDGNKSNIT